MSLVGKYQIGIFFAVTIIFSAVISALAALLGDDSFTILIVLSPTLTALVMTALVSGRAGLRELFVDRLVQRFGWRWLLIALCLVPLLAGAASWAYALIADVPFALATTSLLPYAIVVFVIAIGEEFGWRGYATHELQKRHSPLVAGLIVGAVWALWHFPGSLIGVGTPLETPFLLFAAWVLGAAVIMSWIYAHTKSVVPAILFHAAANASFIYLPFLPENIGSIWPFAALTGVTWAFVVGVFTLRMGNTNSR